MKIGVVTFPGSNCDHDCLHAVQLLGHEAISLWHKDSRSLTNFDGIILPGGFSYGDYLRAGAIARFSPILKNVVEAAKKGVRVLGICNGFQILLESGLLEGAMLRNSKIKFVCKEVSLRVENSQTLFTKKAKKGQILRMPVAHGEGNYFADENTLKRLEDQGQIILRYVNAQGESQTDANPNGALHDIAGICNAEKNVMGMMPHPERRVEDLIGGTDGQVILASFMEKSL